MPREFPFAVPYTEEHFSIIKKIENTEYFHAEKCNLCKRLITVFCSTLFIDKETGHLIAVKKKRYMVKFKNIEAMNCKEVFS